MTAFIVLAKLVASDKSARQQVIDGLTKVKDYSFKSESGVTKYAITIPQDVKDEQSIYMIEEYQDQAALDAHMSSPVVTALLALFTSNPTLLLGPPTIHTLLVTSTFTRPSISSHADPYIVFGTITYKPNTRDAAIEGFGTVSKEAEKTEPGTLMHNVGRNKDEENKINTLEAYESEKYLWDSHAVSVAVKANIESMKDARTDLELVLLKLVGGYFYKE